jgi:hypothetical protein
MLMLKKDTHNQYTYIPFYGKVNSNY